MRPSMARIWGTQKPLISAVCTVEGYALEKVIRPQLPIGFEPVTRAGLPRSGHGSGNTS